MTPPPFRKFSGNSFESGDTGFPKQHMASRSSRVIPANNPSHSWALTNFQALVDSFKHHHHHHHHHKGQSNLYRHHQKNLQVIQVDESESVEAMISLCLVEYKMFGESPCGF